MTLSLPVLKGRQAPLYTAIPSALNQQKPPNAACRELANLSADWNQWVHDQKNMQLNFRKPQPIDTMPPGGRALQNMATLPLASVTFDGTDFPVLVETCPIGYDGIIKLVVNSFDGGTGFLEGNGDIAWRVRIGNKFARNLGNILFTYGSLKEPFSIPGGGIPIISGQTLTYSVSIPTGSPISGGAGAQIACAVFGFYYPRG